MTAATSRPTALDRFGPPILVTALDAARAVRRPVSTVFRWGEQGTIPRQGKDEHGRWLYDLGDVHAADRAHPARTTRAPIETARCTALRRGGDFCDMPTAEGMPFPICTRHALEVFAAIRDTADAVLAGTASAPADRHVEWTRPPREPNPGLIYYALMPTARIKIGTTTNLRRRIQELRINGDDVIATEPGDRDLEQARHRQFAHLYQGREEFDPAPELRDHIEHILDAHGAPSV